ncbi:choline/ethanolaminephosphotransferase 1-like [Ruditapes philippinarum]|uniref:choline/ethanolaminephosphotransferase 1-like n=1 Tax=Ruditapes philippinarum TaxID=129788 RepID=UPI00295A7DAC|nr:choline/ethanolaminephosphotransferase 1-like [Ruditapes philippinarum]
MAAEILNSRQIKALKEHKYSAEGSSICEPFMQVYWRWLVEQIPKTWAPNTITLVGLIINVVSTLILIFYNYDGTKEAPGWVYLGCAIGLFVYQSLDAIDGKQARRTKSNSPLGELFDHGCDSLSTVFVMLGCCISLKLGKDPMVLLFEMCMSEFCFYMAHWQTYVTGILKFGMVDVTEGQFTVIFIYTLCAISPGFFDNTLPVFGIPLRMIAVLGSLGPSLFFMFKTSNLILKGGVGKNKSTVAGSSTIFPIVPIGLVMALQVIIATKTSIYTDQPCLYLVSFGFVSSKITNSLVVAHMTKSEMPLLDWSLLGPMMLFMNQYFNSKFPEYFLLWIVCIYSVQNWIMYSLRVCQEICDHLNIYCFDIVSAPKTERKNSDSRKIR